MDKRFVVWDLGLSCFFRTCDLRPAPIPPVLVFFSSCIVQLRPRCYAVAAGPGCNSGAGSIDCSNVEKPPGEDGECGWYARKCRRTLSGLILMRRNLARRFLVGLRWAQIASPVDRKVIRVGENIGQIQPLSSSFPSERSRLRRIRLSVGCVGCVAHPAFNDPPRTPGTRLRERGCQSSIESFRDR